MSQAPTADVNAAATPDTSVWVQQLPGYAKSLLKIEIPVSATLASRRIPLSEILEIVSGSIITFEKQCDEPMTLEVGNRMIAEGEAVKVGDKFGIRIASILPPDEQFFAVQGLAKQRDAKADDQLSLT